MKNDDYQRYLKENLYGQQGSLKRIAFELVKNHKFIYKIYCHLISWPLRKLKNIPNIKTADKILDIGVGTGFILSYIRDFVNPKAELWGVDMSGNDMLPSYVNFLECNIEENQIPVSDSTFDLVLSTFVLEHLLNPGVLFREAFRVLKNGGYFYCVTEYFTSIFMPDYWNFYQDPTHIRPYTKRTLTTLLRSSGFYKYEVGIIRALEYVLLTPFIPVLNFLSPSNFTFAPFEIIGRTVFCIGQKIDQTDN